MTMTFLGRWLGLPPKPALPPKHDQPTTPIPQDAEAQFNLGRELAEGDPSVRDDAQAAAWYLKAAEQGHCVAQFSLGRMYGQGQGVVRNEVTAAMWLRKAAELGHAGAQYYLGVRQHRASLKLQPSEASEYRIDALKWLHLAVVPGYPAADAAREYVTLGMTREEVAEAGRRAAAFATDFAAANSGVTLVKSAPLQTA